MTFLTNNGLKIEGYWYNSYGDAAKYPMPIAKSDEMQDKIAFLINLTKAQEEAERNSYRGWSNCRICGCMNGSAEYHTDKWLWPSGYQHYINDHNVRPSPEFFEYIMNLQNTDPVIQK